MNKYQILKHNDGRMLAVVWPYEFLYIVDDHLSAQYKTDCEQAIANGVPFKEQSDIDKIRKAIKIKEEPNFKQFGWEMEKMKPYPLPEGLELEIIDLGECKDLYDTSTDVCTCKDNCIKNYAFIKKSEQNKW